MADARLEAFETSLRFTHATASARINNLMLFRLCDNNSDLR